MEKDQNNHLNLPVSEEERFGKVVGYVRDEDNMGMFFRARAPTSATPHKPAEEISIHPDY